MAFIKKKFPPAGKNKNRPGDNEDDDEKKFPDKKFSSVDKDEQSSTKKKFPDKPAPSDEGDDDARNSGSKFYKFKSNDDKKKQWSKDDNEDSDEEDEDNDTDDKKKKKSDWQNATKDPDRDDDDVEHSDVDSKDNDSDDDDEDGDDKGKGGCSCKRQIEINPPLRTQYEAIDALPESMQRDAIDTIIVEQVTKIRAAIAAKAESSGYPYEVLFEVFRRGWFCARGSDHLTEQEIGFNRLNSFLAGGLARRLDEDLIKEDMGINTPADNLVCDSDRPTPGERFKSKVRSKRK